MASTALASPALARDGAWYVGVEAGPMIVEDTDFDIGQTGDVTSVDYDYGFDAGGVVGYDFGPVRIEAEARYAEANVDQVTVGNTGFLASNVRARPGVYPRQWTDRLARVHGERSCGFRSG